jgi:hypothetical protein
MDVGFTVLTQRTDIAPLMIEKISKFGFPETTVSAGVRRDSIRPATAARLTIFRSTQNITSTRPGHREQEFQAYGAPPVVFGSPAIAGHRCFIGRCKGNN